MVSEAQRAILAQAYIVSQNTKALLSSSQAANSFVQNRRHQREKTLEEKQIKDPVGKYDFCQQKQTKKKAC